jgi:hypothetical protein
MGLSPNVSRPKNGSGSGDTISGSDNKMHNDPPDISAHPGLVDAFRTGKRILLPIGTVADFVPGSFFGSNYADTRIQIWERGISGKTLDFRMGIQRVRPLNSF